VCERCRRRFEVQDRTPRRFCGYECSANRDTPMVKPRLPRKGTVDRRIHDALSAGMQQILNGLGQQGPSLPSMQRPARKVRGR